MKIKKKNPCTEFEFIELKFHIYSGVLLVLQWHFKWNSSSLQVFFFFSFIWHNLSSMQSSFSLKLDFNKIEFQNGSMNLNSLEIETYYQIFCAIWAKRQNLSYFNLDIFFLMSQTSNHHVLVKVIKLCKNIKLSTEKVRSK